MNALADEIAALDDRPTLAAPILSGAFVFAADLLRALHKQNLSLPIEFLWLRSYAEARKSSESVSVLVPPGGVLRATHALLIDGVLDHGHTLGVAARLLRDAGARRVTSIVAVDKRRNDAVACADFAAFTHVDRFFVGYGMDDAGQGRGLPFIGAVD